jgi:hypothetical protein
LYFVHVKSKTGGILKEKFVKEWFELFHLF